MQRPKASEMAEISPGEEPLAEIVRWSQGRGATLDWRAEGDRLHVFFACPARASYNANALFRAELTVRISQAAAAIGAKTIRFYECDRAVARIVAVRDVRPGNGGSVERFPIRIRPATAGDGDCLVAIQKLAIDAQSRSHYSSRQVAALLQYKDAPRDASERIFVATTADRTDRAVGFVALSPTCNAVHGIFIDPQYFRQGIGSRLLEYAAIEALQANCWQLQVFAALNAEGFYRANGFVKISSFNTHICGCSIPGLNMRKTLLPQPVPGLLASPVAANDDDGPGIRAPLIGGMLLLGAIALGGALLGISVSPLILLAILVAVGCFQGLCKA